jgi:hypothetical protein
MADTPADTNKKPISATRHIHCAFIVVLCVETWWKELSGAGRAQALAADKATARKNKGPERGTEPFAPLYIDVIASHVAQFRQ